MHAYANDLCTTYPCRTQFYRSHLHRSHHSPLKLGPSLANYTRICQFSRTHILHSIDSSTSADKVPGIYITIPDSSLVSKSLFLTNTQRINVTFISPWPLQKLMQTDQATGTSKRREGSRRDMEGNRAGQVAYERPIDKRPKRHNSDAT